MGDLTQAWQPKSCFEGLTFAATEAEWKTYAQISCLAIIEAGGGKAVTLKNGKAACTHVLARQQCQASCEWGEEAQKTLVNPLWLWESYEGGSLLPLSDPMYRPFPAKPIPGASEFQVTVTGFMGPLRNQMLDLLTSMGMDVQRAMPPQTITHVVASDLHDKTSKKLEHARKVQATRRVCIINCVWIFNCLRTWSLLPEGEYADNPDPAHDPAQGARVCASYGDGPNSLGDTVQDSEDEENPLRLSGGLLSGGPSRDRTPAAHTQDPGMLITPVTDVPSSSRARVQAPAWRSKRSGDASRSRLGQAGAPGSGAAPGTKQKENQSPAVVRPVQHSGDTVREGSGRLTVPPPAAFNNGLASQLAAGQVEEAQAMTGRLVDQLAAFESAPAQPMGDDVAAAVDGQQEHVPCIASTALEARSDVEIDIEALEQPEVLPAAAKGKAAQAKQKSVAAEHLPKKRKLLSKKAATAPVLHPQREAGEPSAAVKAAEPEHRELFPNKKRKPQPALPRRDYDSAPLHTPQAKPPQASPSPEQPPSVPAEPGTDARPGSAKRVFIALSGLHTAETNEYRRLLRELHIGHTSGLEKHVWEDRVTHVVAPALKRVAKVLAAMAAGAWVVSTEFLDASQTARTLVDPDDYELEENSADLMAQGTPYHWRMRAHSLGHGAFHGLKVHVLGQFKGGEKPNRPEIESILKAGGAKLVDSTEAASAGTDLVIMHPSTPRDHPKVQPVLRAKICCASPGYFVEWLAKPKDNLRQYLLHKTKPGAALSKMAAERHLSLDPAESCSL